MAFFTPYGTRELLLFGGGSLLICLLASVATIWTSGGAPKIISLAIALLFFGIFLLALNFFRDPERTTPPGDHLLISPADGVIADITTLDEPRFIKGKAVRIGIFMDAFNVHVNRAPLSGTVRFLQHEDGLFKAVYTAEAAMQNEKQWLGIECDREKMPLLVCQVAGLLARRIVCDLKEGDTVQRGKRFGMIKFGSRLEVYIPAGTAHELRVKLGDKTVAGETVLLALPENK